GPVVECTGAGRSASGHFQVQAGKGLFELSDTGSVLIRPLVITNNNPNYIALGPQYTVWWDKRDYTSIWSHVTGKTISLPFDWHNFRHVSYSLIGDSLVYFNALTGTTEYNIHTGFTKLFLPGKEVSRTFRDDSGNLWFTTMGEGIYRLNSDEFSTIRLLAAGGAQTAVYSVMRTGQELWSGNSLNHVFKL